MHVAGRRGRRRQAQVPGLRAASPARGSARRSGRRPPTSTPSSRGTTPARSGRSRGRPTRASTPTSTTTSSTTNAYGKLDLDRPHQFRFGGTYTFPFGLQARPGFYVRSGTPYGKSGWFNDFYHDRALPRRSAAPPAAPRPSGTPTSRSPTTGGSGPVTITPQFFVYSVFNNQIINSYNTRFNPNGSFVDNPSSQYYGQAGVEPGTRRLRCRRRALHRQRRLPEGQRPQQPAHRSASPLKIGF